MSFAVPENLAKSFLAAADEIAGAAEREAAEEARRTREKLKAKLGRIVDDYERDMEPVVLAIARLPEKDGGKFTVKHAAHRSSTVSMDVQVIYAKGSTESRFAIEAMTTVDGKDSFSLQMEPKLPQVKENPSAKFADVTKLLAWWFATVAPERLNDLKDIMMPDVSVTLKHDMKASNVLKLKPSQQ
jgi:hypothetical protein